MFIIHFSKLINTLNYESTTCHRILLVTNRNMASWTYDTFDNNLRKNNDFYKELKRRKAQSSLSLEGILYCCESASTIMLLHCTNKNVHSIIYKQSKISHFV